MSRYDNPALDQMRREAWIGVAIVVAISVVTYANQMLAYGKSASELSYTLGFPTWFFIHIFVIYPVFFAILWYVARNYISMPDLENTTSLITERKPNAENESGTFQESSRQEVSE